MTKEELQICDEKADAAIKAMIASMIGGAVIPAAINWAIVAAAMGAGCVAVGKAYGIKLTKEQGGALCKEFILGAGLTFLALNVGTKLIAGILEATGLGYGAGVALDAVVSAAQAYAVGWSAKTHFRKLVQGEKATPEELRKVFRAKFKEFKKSHSN